MKPKCELLKAIERRLFWQAVYDGIQQRIAGIKLSHWQRRNRKTANELERRGVL